MPDGIHDKAQVIAEFERHYPFALDQFQREAVDALADGRSVLVAAPTGTGKTLIAEFAVYLARLRSRRVMYTTPIKALSNQKFRDFRAAYGDDVGLLTGDVVENRQGQIIVMTTEVLRNMMLQTPKELDDVGVVIFDEVHYLADPERGTAWEEAIILAPEHLQLVCLSATVTNASEIAAWIALVHQPIQLIEYLSRAVPLLHYYYLDNQLNLVLDEEHHLVADFPNVGGEARRRIRAGWSVGEEDSPRPVTRQEPDPIEIVQALQRDDMLPAIYFLFSRRDCEAAADVCAMMRLRLVRDVQRMREISHIVQTYLDRLAPEDRSLQQVKAIARLAYRGFGFHHAGLLPVLKQMVEELFSAGLMGVVFATDTLALGINMPARTVVVGRMSKFDGQSRRPLIPNEFQQMAGRAGRRGIDDCGHVVVPYSPWMPFREVLDIAIGPLYPVQSGFTLRYNTVLNLWSPPAGQRVQQVQRDSLMQFQMAHETRNLAAVVQQRQQQIDAVPRGCLIGYAAGEELLSEYEGLSRSKAVLRHELEDLTREQARIEARFASRPWSRPAREHLRQIFRRLPPGTVVHVEGEGWTVFLGRSESGGKGLFLAGERVLRLDGYHQVDYLPAPPITIKLPPRLLDIRDAAPDARATVPAEDWQRLQDELGGASLPDLDAWLAGYQAQLRGDLAEEAERVGQGLSDARAELSGLHQRLAQHVCDPCQVRKQHRRNLREAARLMEDKADAERELEKHIRYEEQRAERVLGAIVTVLHQFGYLKRGYPTAKAAQLANIFDLNGLMIAESIAAGWLHSLGAEDLAEVFSWFAYDRDVEFHNHFMLPHNLVRLRRDLDELQARVLAAERRNDIMLTIGYNYYFFGMARAWCRGSAFAEILDKVDLGEGDLVMTFNKTVDLLRQVEDMLAKVIPDDPLRGKLRQAQRLMRRGIIEQSLALGLAPVQPAPPVPPPAVKDVEAELLRLRQREAEDQAERRPRPETPMRWRRPGQPAIGRFTRPRMPRRGMRP